MIVDTAGIFADGGAYVPTQEKKRLTHFCRWAGLMSTQEKKVNAFSPLGRQSVHTRKKRSIKKDKRKKINSTKIRFK